MINGIASHSKPLDDPFLLDFKQLLLHQQQENMYPYLYSTPDPSKENDPACGETHYNDLIGNVPDYYLYRNELQILQNSANRIASYVPQEATILEFGVGTEMAFKNKTLPFLKAIDQLQVYVSIDRQELAQNRHLDLTYIRGAHRYIPEIKELFYDPQRLARVSELAGVELEPDPLSIVSSFITFMGTDEGRVGWHSDGPPVNEMIPLVIEGDYEGGELQLYRGNADLGRLELEQKGEIASDNILSLQHQMGCSTLAQLFRVLHQVSPIKRGRRITLMLAHRSKEKPYINDNAMWYLAADNPEFEWVEEYVADIKERQYPAYSRHQLALPNKK